MENLKRAYSYRLAIATPAPNPTSTVNRSTKVQRASAIRAIKRNRDAHLKLQEEANALIRNLNYLHILDANSSVPVVNLEKEAKRLKRKVNKSERNSARWSSRPGPGTVASAFYY